MKRTPGSGGRSKRVTSGGGGVHKRSGYSGSGRPVGRSDGYSGRKGSSSSSGGFSSGSNHSSGGSSGGYRSSSSSGLISLILGLLLGNNGLLSKLISLLKRNKTARIIALILAVLLIFYFVSNGSCTSCSLGNIGSIGSGITSSDFSVAGDNANESNADMSVSNLARDKRTDIVGGGNDVVTIMVYLCGTDLESKYGMATSDLKEMMKANIADNVNIIVQTGGTNKWNNSTISSNKNQIYKVTSQGLVRLEETVGKKPMVDPNTLTEFINYCESNYEADRYMLIMWDHGGGSLSGYGYDEKFPTDGSMTLDEFDSALAQAGCVFDFIGFDACLMATLETALVCEKYADYLIASEETEPGVGWYYTNWITELSENTSMNTVEIGKNIIDDFVDVCRQASPNDKTTLSIIDLAEMAGTVPEAFNEFSTSTTELIDSDNYKVVSDARSKTKEFSSGINQVDLIHLAKNIGTEEALDFAKALQSCVKYNRTSSNIANAYGISIFFPYGSTSSVSSAIKTYDKIGLDDSYSECIKSFASITAGGQMLTGGNGMDSMLGSLLGTSSASGTSGDTLVDIISMLGGSSGSSNTTTDLVGTALDLFLGSSGSSSSTGIDVGQLADWFTSDRVMNNAESYAENYLDPERLAATEKDGGYVLSLTDEEWELVHDIQLNVFYDDGEGYIDLGMDNVYTFDNDLDLVMDYDGTWLAINGNIVSYYMISNDTDGDNYVITGRVPALLNGQLVDIILVFSNENEYGVVAGARINYNGLTQAQAKGLIEIKSGDVIDFLCDYYTYEGEYVSSYYLGEQFIVPEGELTISNVSVGNNPCRFGYCLTDSYGSEMWTDMLDYN